MAGSRLRITDACWSGRRIGPITRSIRMEAVAHRIVQGDARSDAPQFVTDERVTRLQALVPLDPEHMPAAARASTRPWGSRRWPGW